MPPDPSTDMAGVALSIAASLRNEHFGSGPRAALRRMAPSNTALPALQRLLAEQVPDHWLDARGMADWALITHCLALASPDNLVNAKALGAALAKAEFSESRMARLLQANRAQLDTLLPRACRFLSAKGEALHAAGLARFVRALSSSDPSAFDSARTRLATEYYRALRMLDSSATQDISA